MQYICGQIRLSHHSHQFASDIGPLLILRLPPAVPLRSLPKSGTGEVGVVWRGPQQSGGDRGGAGRCRPLLLGGVGWSRDHVAGHHGCHHCHQPSSKSGLRPAPTRLEAGPRGPSPIGPKTWEGRLLGDPCVPAKSGADRGGPRGCPGSGASAQAAKGISVSK